MVRLGIGLHGIGRSKALQPVSSFKTSISQVRTVRKGETIGYSRRGIAARDSRIATIPVGYADGLNRRFGNGVGEVWINGIYAPTIGNICMDMTMIDVTGMEVVEGDQVEIFGKHQSVSDLARQVRNHSLRNTNFHSRAGEKSIFAGIIMKVQDLSSHYHLQRGTKYPALP